MKTENHLLPCLMALVGTSSSLCAAWISPLPIYICCPSSSCPHWWVKGNSSASWPHPCFYSPGCCWLLHGLLPISTLVISLELFTNKLVSDRTVSRNYSFPRMILHISLLVFLQFSLPIPSGCLGHSERQLSSWVCCPDDQSGAICKCGVSAAHQLLQFIDEDVSTK